MKFRSAADAAAEFQRSRERRQSRKPPAFTPLRLPTSLYEELIAHCRSFGITPTTYVRRTLEMAKLSRGGT